MRNPGFFRTVFVSWVMTASSSAVLAGPGELDVRFGTRGWLDLPQMDLVTAAVSDPDGSVIIAGYQWPNDSSLLVNPHPAALVVRVSASGAMQWTRNLGMGYSPKVQRLQDGRVLVGFSSYYDGAKAVIVALRVDGGIDEGFGDHGSMRLQRSMVVAGAGTTQAGMALRSIRELSSGEILISAQVTDDTIPTAWDPATLGVLFRISADGRLLDPPAPALTLMRERVPSHTELLPDGRGLVLAAPGCCRDLRALLLSRDASGALSESPATVDAAWSPEALTHDASLQRFHAKGRWNSEPSLLALHADGSIDTSFGNDGPGRVRLAPHTGPGELLVDDGGALVAVSVPQLPDWRNLFAIATSRPGLLIGRWYASGIQDPRIDGGNVVPLADPFGRSTSSVVSISRADRGYAWVAATIDTQTKSAGRLARLQLSEGVGHGTIGFQISTIRISEQGSPKIVRVVRSGGSSGPVSVRYEVSAASTSGLIPTSGVLSWPDGDASSRLIEIQAQNDVQLEGEHSQTVRLFDATGGADLVTEPLTVIIEDDETLAQLGNLCTGHSG